MLRRELIKELSAEAKDPRGITFRLPNWFISDLRDKIDVAPKIDYVHDRQLIRLTFQLEDCKAVILAKPPTAQDPDLLQRPHLLIIPLGHNDLLGLRSPTRAPPPGGPADPYEQGQESGGKAYKTASPPPRGNSPAVAAASLVHPRPAASARPPGAK